jgi:Big-like domain-containing protein
VRVTRAPRIVSVLFAVAAIACARIEPPPGGPPDTSPPQLLATRPDSFARIPGFRGSVEFRFDEVISEGSSANEGTGTGDLEKLVILSPSTKVPEVSWHRDRIDVRPSGGWQPDRVYRVELLPGVTDLRRNRSDTGAVLTFTTGAPLPATSIQGTVVDWTTSRPAPAALVEAILLPDSLPYRGVTDSSGHISLGPLPAGDYLVRGVLDQNHNMRLDPREAFDSVRLARGKTSAGELWAFVHDTTPPRIRTITVADSVSATIELTQSLDPRQRLTPAGAIVRLLPDSTPVRVASLLPKPVDDSLHARPTTARDTTARDTTARDTTAARRPGIAAAEPKPLTTRPPLTDRLVLRVQQRWRPDTKYAVEIRGLRNLTGVTGNATGVLTVSKTPSADSLRRAADSLKRTPPDSVRNRAPRKTP